MTNLYYIDKSGGVQGPVSLDELKVLHKKGTISHKTEVCENGKTKWVPFFEYNKGSQNLISSSNPKPQGNPDEKKSGKKNSKPTKTNGMISKFQVNVIIAIMLVGLGVPFWGNFKPIPKWEYATESIVADVPIENLFNKKHSYKTIPRFASSLDSRGQNGWELVDTFLEHETAHPNFGKDDYVTGIQPNVRPQRLVLIFKRPL